MSKSVLTLFVVFGSCLPACFGEINYPQLALGGGYECTMLISNLTDSPWSGQLLARRGAGEAWSVDWLDLGATSSSSQHNLSLEGNTTRKIVLSSSEDLASGYLVVESDLNSTDDLAVSFFYRYTGQGGQLIDSTGIAAGNRGTSFVVPVERGTGLDTGIAWAPTQASDVPNTGFDFQATLVDGAGNVIQQKAVTMEGHSASFFSELFDAVPDEFVGRIRVDSPESLYLTALRLESAADQFQLTSVPPERLRDQPGGPKNFEIDYDSLLWPNSYMFTGRVKNLTVADALFPGVAVAFYDADGNFLGGGSDFIIGKTRSVYHSLNTNTCLRPGETGYFSIPMSSIPQDSIDHFEMFVTANEVIETADPVGRVELVKLSQINYGGNLELRGTIANTGTGDAERVRLHCFLLDDTGRVIGWSYITPTVDSLAPGQSVGFMKATQVSYSDVAEVVPSLVWQPVSATTTVQPADAGPSVKLSRTEEILRMRERFTAEHPDVGTTRESISGAIPRK